MLLVTAHSERSPCIYGEQYYLDPLMVRRLVYLDRRLFKFRMIETSIFSKVTLVSYYVLIK